MKAQTSKEMEANGQFPLPPPIGRAITDEDVLRALKAAYPRGLTRRGVAQAVGRHVTPTIIGRLNRLVGESKVISEVQEWPNRARGYVYYFRVQEDADL
jgi:hypothetical protein